MHSRWLILALGALHPPWLILALGAMHPTPSLATPVLLSGTLCKRNTRQTSQNYQMTSKPPASWTSCRHHATCVSQVPGRHTCPPFLPGQDAPAQSFTDITSLCCLFHSRRCSMLMNSNEMRVKRTNYHTGDVCPFHAITWLTAVT